MELVDSTFVSDFLGALPDFFGFILCGLLVGLFAWAVAKMIMTCIGFLRP